MRNIIIKSILNLHSLVLVYALFCSCQTPLQNNETSDIVLDEESELLPLTEKEIMLIRVKLAKVRFPIGINELHESIGLDWRHFRKSFYIVNNEMIEWMDGCWTHSRKLDCKVSFIRREKIEVSRF